MFSRRCHESMSQVLPFYVVTMVTYFYCFDCLEEPLEAEVLGQALHGRGHDVMSVIV